MNNICEIAQLGAKALRQPAYLVDNVNSADIQKIIADMKATLAATQGVGLAAPQISQNKRIIIVASRPTARYPLAPAMMPTVMINPVYQTLSNETEKDWEGCLSVPGIRGLVPRYKNIKVSCIDEKGDDIDLIMEGFVARVFQHEVDHLDGMIYLDRVESSHDLISESEYFKLFN